MMLYGRQADPPMAPPPPVELSADPIAAVLAITCIMVVVVAVKTGFRQFVSKQLGWDDLMAILGALITISMAGVIVSVFKEAGLDSSTASASPMQIADPKFKDRLFVYLLLSAVPNGFAKLAILFLLLKAFPRIARPITAYFVYAGIVVATLFYVIQVLYVGIHCGPQNATPCSVPTQVNLARACACINLILDVYILVIAIANVWTLQLTTKRKMGLVLVFLTGLLALVCSIIVLYYRYTTTLDPKAVWVTVLTPLILAIYEPCIALIAACLPTYPALWRSAYNTAAFSSVRNLLSQLSSRSRSQGSVELTDVPSKEHLGRPSTTRSNPKQSHDTTTVDLESQNDR